MINETSALLSLSIFSLDAVSPGTGVACIIQQCVGGIHQCVGGRANDNT